MAYFSNGTEGDRYEEEWCTKCCHYDGQGEECCPVWELHMIHNYDECNKQDSFLHTLIPMKDGFADRCRMFISKFDY